MSGLQTFSFPQFRQKWLNAFAASRGIDPNFVPGKATLAIAEASADQAINVQLLDETTMNFARSTTCTGEDLDSFYAQFRFPRLPAEVAFGTVTFSTPVANAQVAYVPVGTLIQIPGGLIQYEVIADPSQSSFNSSKNAYVLPAGLTSINATAAATSTGNSYNVQANQLIQIVNTLYGIPSVTNLVAITNGHAAETDEAYRARFIDYINNLSKATQGAILEAELRVQPGLKVALFENVQFIGNPPTSVNTPYYGMVSAIIDDGSGNPPQSLLDAALVAMSDTVAYGMQYQILKPAVISPNVNLTIRLKATGDLDVVTPLIKAAIISYVNNLAIGTSDPENDGLIFVSKIYTIGQTTPGVESVLANSVTIDGVEEDFQLLAWQEALLTDSDIQVTV